MRRAERRGVGAEFGRVAGLRVGPCALGVSSEKIDNRQALSIPLGTMRSYSCGVEMRARFVLVGD